MSESPHSSQIVASLDVVRDLQADFVKGLEKVVSPHGETISFDKVSWLRDEGKHGGGERFFTRDNAVFNRASVNVSHIHYHDLPEKSLASATAISTIIHPANPHAPSMHMHISWTEMKDGKGYWRMMADLNPAIVYDDDKEAFEATFRDVAPQYAKEAVAQGERYFYIPALERHRGVAHFYLEGYSSGDFAADEQLARSLGSSVIASYLSILQNAVTTRTEITESNKYAQLAYHTLYFFQVLTLDRGTTSGLLVHDQNDLGIMGSLPEVVDKPLLASWRERMASPQDSLLDALVEALPDSGTVDDVVRVKLAQVVRDHYRANPDALQMQARGDIIPPTVENHR